MALVGQDHDLDDFPYGINNKWLGFNYGEAMTMVRHRLVCDEEYDQSLFKGVCTVGLNNRYAAFFHKLK